jgi:hypothetical protein
MNHMLAADWFNLPLSLKLASVLIPSLTVAIAKFSWVDFKSYKSYSGRFGHAVYFLIYWVMLSVIFAVVVPCTVVFLHDPIHGWFIAPALLAVGVGLFRWRI